MEQMLAPRGESLLNFQDLSQHVPVQYRKRVPGHVIIDGPGLKIINSNEFQEALELESSDLKDQDVKPFRRLYPTTEANSGRITLKLNGMVQG
ncbi:hypothetical protein GJ744_003161 [Endocarpon pusillum]|uniref:Uncharacterized protein n=1 Tax=Endocarpon pusillum TaxID=364733 RepID=A0A8H7AML3_9EURO|nr:hypothetical protein GJ744_003161 [Endocarpon pusillum]